MGNKVTLEVGYSQDHVKVEIDEDRLAGVYYPNKVEVGDEAETIRNALANPVDSPDFAEFLSGEGKVLVIVNDGTRPTPTAKVLDEIGEDSARLTVWMTRPNHDDPARIRIRINRNAATVIGGNDYKKGKLVVPIRVRYPSGQ